MEQDNLDEILTYLTNLQTNIMNAEVMDKQIAIAMTKAMILIMERVIGMETHLIMAAVEAKRRQAGNDSKILLVPANTLNGGEK